MNIELLKKYEQIYIIGHKNPDTDTIVSSKILSDIFNFYKIKSNYVVIEGETLNQYNQKMIDECMDYKPLIIKKNDIKNHLYFLVDHNDIKQSINDSTLVIGCIDHHPDSGIIKNVIFTDYCCTALYIYFLFKDMYKFSNEQKYQIYMAFLNDSSFGKSSRYNKKDELLASTLGFKNNYNELFTKFFIPTDLSNLNYAFENSNLKSYKFNDWQFKSSCIESYDIFRLNEYKSFIKNSNNFLGIWIDYENNKTYAFFKYEKDYIEKEYDFIASRATTIINDVLDFLKKLD